MKLHTLMNRSLAAASLAIGALAMAMPAHAKIVTLTFSGTYHTPYGPTYGLEGESIPYSYQLRYDTALDTNQEFFAAGTQLGDYVTTHEWHGYSASGLLSVTPLRFGTKTWALGDLADRPPASGVTADLWFDTDIGQSTPTRSWITFIGGDFEDYGIFELGGGMTDGVSVYLESDASISTFPGGAFSDHATITSVPEPNPVLFMVAGLGILLLRTRRQ